MRSYIEVENVSKRFGKKSILENISLTFCKNDTYDYIGKDASLENLDMMSAISDMQKDKVLEQYQYFVKPKDVLLSDVDGTVIQK